MEPELTREKIHGLTKALHKLRKQGYQVDQPKTGLGFTPVEPVRIRVTKKEKCVNVQHIFVEGDGKEKKPSDNRVSVFDRLSTPTARSSIFGRLGSSSRIPNVQDRLDVSSIPQSSVFNRLGGGSTQQLKKRNHAGETDMAGSRNNNQTLILSQPQGSKSSLVLITIDGAVKVKQRIISNSHRSNENNPNEDEVEVIISSNYASVDEDSDPEASNDEIQEALPQLEDGGQATVDELKELNLDTKDEPHPIFFSLQESNPNTVKKKSWNQLCDLELIGLKSFEQWMGVRNRDGFLHLERPSDWPSVGEIMRQPHNNGLPLGNSSPRGKPLLRGIFPGASGHPAVVLEHWASGIGMFLLNSFILGFANSSFGI
ncbi:hypothetical protein BUALT_Bualt15G0136500 [Buddleja alternifolia]|uniref:Uncharacterized protein n=1 Tax=Buddleja alternifolia TaxID=168488 RepID=A0AAV6WQL5_9LAMI|nr:hypothetical protein BUALT_Bualt15G0136500 [Buddleja alternifolia]